MKKRAHRIILSKIRISNHRLAIEMGRFSKTPQNERICLHCKTDNVSEIDDELWLRKFFLIYTTLSGGLNLYFCWFCFQIWMCGGKVFIVTCSRVGHVFRKTSPYSWPGGVARIINHNTQRIVEVWMDEYKDFFYKINPGNPLNHCHADTFV